MSNRSSFNNQFLSWVSAFSIISILIGAMVLVGYYFDIVALKSITPFWLAMKANTAVCCILCGMALWCLRSEYPNTISFLVVNLIAIIIVVFSILTFYEYLFKVNLGFDQFLFLDKQRLQDIIYPGRTSVATTLSLFFLGISLLFIDKKFISPWLYQISSCIVLTIAFFGLLSYFYNVNTTFAFTYFTQMALNTSIVLIIISIAIILSRPHEGIVKELQGNTLGAKSMRFLLPFSFILLTFIGFFENVGEKINLFGPEFGDNVQLTGSIIGEFILILYNAKMLDKEKDVGQQKQN